MEEGGREREKPHFQPFFSGLNFCSVLMTLCGVVFFHHTSHQQKEFLKYLHPVKTSSFCLGNGGRGERERKASFSTIFSGLNFCSVLMTLCGVVFFHHTSHQQKEFLKYLHPVKTSSFCLGNGGRGEREKKPHFQPFFLGSIFAAC